MSDMTDLTIAPFPDDDLASMVKWRTDPDVNKYIRAGLRTLEAVRKWYDEYFSAAENLLFAIRLEGNLIGYCTIEHIDRDNRKCEVGIVIGEKTHWRKGIGKAALRLLLDRVFSELQMHRVEAIIYEDNAASVNCFTRVGFQFEGRLRQAKRIGGKYGDVLVYGLLRPEWTAPSAASNRPPQGMPDRPAPLS